VKDIARWLGLNRQTVDAMVRDGRLPAPLQMGLRKRVWTATDIAAWVQTRRQITDACRNNSFVSSSAMSNIVEGAGV